VDPRGIARRRLGSEGVGHARRKKMPVPESVRGGQGMETMSGDIRMRIDSFDRQATCSKGQFSGRMA